MPSYKFKIADAGNKLLVVDVELPTFGSSRVPSNPDSHWTTETPGLIAQEMGRCHETSADAPRPDATTDDPPPAPVSGDAAIPALDYGTSHLSLCMMLEPYLVGLVLGGFHSGFSANESGDG
jgi:hypothetical protein